MHGRDICLSAYFFVDLYAIQLEKILSNLIFLLVYNTAILKVIYGKACRR